ncbi:MAG: LamG domain-containing protein [Usitatibacter sp.]
MRAARLVFWAMLSVASCSAFAQLSPVATYHLGESDPGAAPGASGAALTADSSGAADLARIGIPTYSTFGSPASAIGMTFAGAEGYRNVAVVTSATDNFGMEAWVYATSAAGNAVIAYNGNTGTSGFGLFRNGGTYTYLFGGVAFGGAVPVALNTWTHLAVVRDSGVTTLYVNGRANIVTGDAPNAAAGAMGVGINPVVMAEQFIGTIDEVRVFTFAPGTFQPAQLLLAVARPVPTLQWQVQLLLALMLAALAFRQIRRG